MRKSVLPTSTSRAFPSPSNNAVVRCRGIFQAFLEFPKARKRDCETILRISTTFSTARRKVGRERHERERERKV